MSNPATGNHGEISNTGLESELFFECFWFEQACNELNAFVASDLPIKGDPLLHNLRTWSYLDRMLIHAARISRLVDPPLKFDPNKESKESYEERLRFASELRWRVNPSVLQSKDLRACRNALEHANEGIVDYVRKHRDRRTGPFSTDWSKDGRVESEVKGFRRWHQATGECLVFGKPTNLLRTYAVVKIIQGVVHPHVTSELQGSDVADGA
jgi:hypothetical protein